MEERQDLISRQAAIKALVEFTHLEWKYLKLLYPVLEVLEQLPSAQPERKKGKWIVVDDGVISGKCSVCGWEAHMYEDDVMGMDFCPNCGARLEGESC